MQVVAVPARIDADNAVDVLAKLSEALANGDSAGDGPAAGTAARAGRLALDLAPLQHFDSSALSLLLQLARGRHPNGTDENHGGGDPQAAQPLFLLNPPAKLQELAELYGVAEMLFGSAGKGVEAHAAK